MTPDEPQGEVPVERRRYPRRAIKLTVNIRCLEKSHISPEESRLVADLGAGGLSMRSLKPLEPGQILLLKLMLPAHSEPHAPTGLADASRVVTMLSRVVWCKASNQGDHLIGVQFLDLDVENRRKLKAFLVEYRLLDPSSNLFF